MNNPILNLSAWIERRKSAVGTYSDHIVHSVKAYETHITEQAAEIERLTKVLKSVSEALYGEPEYHEQGMGCGLEDRCITDRYEAMAFGWDQAMERVYGEHINDALSDVTAALNKEKANETT